MTSSVRILAPILILLGGIWFLQGINILPGSFMTGDPRWAVAGVVCAIAGIAVWMLSRRLPKK
jgi:hypothetical protein